MMLKDVFFDPENPAEEWPIARLLAVWFEDADKSQNGFLERDEFIGALAPLGPALQMAESR